MQTGISFSVSDSFSVAVFCSFSAAVKSTVLKDWLPHVSVERKEALVGMGEGKNRSVISLCYYCMRGVLFGIHFHSTFLLF